ncbi:MAG: putative porin [Flavisolibacter sp.]
MDDLKNTIVHRIAFLLIISFVSTSLLAQRGNILQGISNRIGNLSGQSGSTGDSLRSRVKEEDSITIRFYYKDSSGARKLDSSILDFTTRFPIPATHIYLGNTGSATKSILFNPQLKAGFDPGFHAFDVYKWKLETIPFFNTTKPYTELAYEIASKAEQIIELQHTQNFKPYWNIGLHYRLISAPGVFRNQKTSHNNYSITSWYQSPSKRYNNYFIILSNKLQSEQSGGILNDKDYLNDPVYSTDRFTIPSFIGGDPRYSNAANFFSSSINTGNIYKETNYYLRQQYDFGRKDSLVTDSTVIPLFYPRVRFEHTFNYGKYSYAFQDIPSGTNQPDSAYYASRYNFKLPASNDSAVSFRDQWHEISNDFSIYQFPDANNLQQFIKLGLEVQLLKGDVKTSRSLYNMAGHGEYRNRSKNQKWDINAFGRLYLNGYNMGDYHAYASLQRLINPRVGSLQLGFENINRTPPFIYNTSSNFYLDDPAKSFGKENTTHFFGSVWMPKLKLQLSADYYLISNYLYLTDFYKLQQEATLFNVLRINAAKTFSIGRFWKWHAEAYVQQKTGTANLNIPTFYTRNRFGYEGKLGLKNLNIAFGVELRYNTPYKADNFSPVLGQFFYQDSITINNLPRIDGYLHMRIRSFRAFLRFENLNTADVRNGFGFTNNNFAAPGYPTPGLITRFGIYWPFIN